MTVIRKKAFKDVPISIKVRKPHYYYQDLNKIYPYNYINLKEFEGLDYEFRKGVVKFYEKPLWDYKISPDIKRVLAPKGDSYLTIESTPDFYSVVGNLSVYKNVVSGFSSTDYIKPNFTFAPKSNPWEMMFKVKTSLDLSGTQYIYQSCSGTGSAGRWGVIVYNTDVWKLGISANNSSWLVSGVGTHTIIPDTVYWIKLVFTGSKYELSYSTDGEEFIVDISVEESGVLYSSLPYTYMGIYSTTNFTNPQRGTIYLDDCYIKINDELVWSKHIVKDTVVEEKGCLDEGVDVFGAKNLTAFVRGTEIILSDDEEKEGYTWGGNVKVPNVLTKVYKKSYDIEGNITYDEKINAIGFGATSWILTPEIFGNQPYTFVTKIKINSSADGNMILTAHNTDSKTPQIYLKKSTGALTVYGTSGINGVTVVPVNTWYWIKLEWDGTTLKWYTAPAVEGTSYFEPAWTLENSVAENIFNVKQVFRFGGPSNTLTYYLHGAIDLINTKYSENGKVVWQPLKEV